MIVVKESMELTLHDKEKITIDNEDISSLMHTNDRTTYVPYGAVISIEKKTTKTDEEVKNDFCTDIPVAEVKDCFGEE